MRSLPKFSRADVAAGTQVWVVAGATDMRRSFDGLAAQIQTQLSADAFSGQAFVFRGRKGDRVKPLWWDGTGLVLYAKRLEGTHFVWPQIKSGTIQLTAAQLALLLEGLEWCLVRERAGPQLAV